MTTATRNEAAERLLHRPIEGEPEGGTCHRCGRDFRWVHPDGLCALCFALTVATADEVTG